MSLLLRFYDPSCGQVLLDGTDIKEMNVRYSVADRCGSEPVLFWPHCNEYIERAQQGDTELTTFDECMALSDENTRNGVDTVAETKRTRPVLSRILRSWR